jgi:hypothetical protein
MPNVTQDEQPTVDRFSRLLEDHPNCFERDCWAGHITGSALAPRPEPEQVTADPSP